MMDQSLDLLMWRSGLAHAPEVPDANLVTQWADLCLAHMMKDAARTLYELAFVTQGFAPQCLAWQADIAARTRLWRDLPPADVAAVPSVSNTVEIAIAELRDLGAMIARQRIAGEADAAPVATMRSAKERPIDVGQLIHHLHIALRAPVSSDGAPDAAMLMTRLGMIHRHDFAVDYRRLGLAAPSLLVSAIGHGRLKAFVRLNHDLVLGAHGSFEMLHRAARFDLAGLGPYFGNVPRLARRSRDIFELAEVVHVAAGGAGRDPIGRHGWIALLMQSVSGMLRDEVVDDLGDLGAMDALTLIFEREARQPEHLANFDFTARLRDSALDNEDLDLAARAQARLVRLRPGSMIERVILGSIQGTAGMVKAAEQTFLACLQDAPEDKDVKQRLAAVRAGRFEPYRVGSGFGTPEDRRIRRQNRMRDATVAVVRAPRKRMAAVEL